MSNLNIERDHDLGLDKARELTDKLIASSEEKYGIKCELDRQDDKDVVDLKRKGLNGTLITTADQIKLDAKLGFLLKGFLPKIKSEIEKGLDKHLG